jgi:hypothetical protein
LILYNKIAFSRDMFGYVVNKKPQKSEDFP